MKFLVGLFLVAFMATAVKAEMNMIKGPVPTAASIDTSSTNITAAAYVTFVASTSYACSAILIHNPGAQPIKMAIGAAASEVDTGLVIPIGVSAFIPAQIPKAKRLSLRSLGGTQSSGIITMSCFQ